MAANSVAPQLDEIARGAVIDLRAEKKIGAKEIERFSIASSGPQMLVAVLSGGGQQKVLFSRWVRACPRDLVLDEPTRGIGDNAQTKLDKLDALLANILTPAKSFRKEPGSVAFIAAKGHWAPIV